MIPLINGLEAGVSRRIEEMDNNTDVQLAASHTHCRHFHSHFKLYWLSDEVIYIYSDELDIYLADIFFRVLNRYSHIKKNDMQPSTLDCQRCSNGEIILISLWQLAKSLRFEIDIDLLVEMRLRKFLYFWVVKLCQQNRRGRGKFKIS